MPRAFNFVSCPADRNARWNPYSFLSETLAVSWLWQALNFRKVNAKINRQVFYNLNTKLGRILCLLCPILKTKSFAENNATLTKKLKTINEFLIDLTSDSRKLFPRAKILGVYGGLTFLDFSVFQSFCFYEKDLKLEKVRA